MSDRRPDTRIAIEEPPDESVVTGGVVSNSWTLFASAKATIDAVSGGETTIGEASIGVQQYMVTFRSQAFRVPTTYRIRPTSGPLSGALLYIIASAPYGSKRSRQIRAICKEGRA